MNLLLLEASEVVSGTAHLNDARATHVREVLRSAAGDTVRVGILDGPKGTATVRALDAEGVTLTCSFEPTIDPPPSDTLLLAVPRPRVLARCLAHAAALGFGRIVLFRSRRVDKSYLGSRLLQPDQTRAHLISGLAQARRTRVPEVRIFPLFRPFVEDVLDGLVPAELRIVAHPTAARETAGLRLDAATPLTLAIGPEGGFIPFEIDALTERGFIPVRAGDHPLRVETALVYVSGQLALLRQLS